MQTSRFQLGLMALLALSLGFSLASSEAVGYPAGPVVSFGATPLWSKTGTVGGAATSEILTVPDGQVAVVTGFHSDSTAYLDIYQDGSLRMDATSDAAAANAAFGQNQGTLTIAGGTQLILRNTSGSTRYYFIQGYYAQP